MNPKKKSRPGKDGSKQERHSSLLSAAAVAGSRKYRRGMGAEAAREANRRMRRYVEQLCECYESRPEDIPPWIVYNKLRPFWVDMKTEPTMETRRQAQALFDDEISKADCFRPYKMAQKQEYWVRVLHWLKRAMYDRGVLLNPRNVHHPDFAKIRVQVLEAAIERGLLWERRSPKGSKKISRVGPMPRMQRLPEKDPWQFDPNRLKQYVFLRKRDDKSDLLSFEGLMAKPPWHVAYDTQKKLKVINRVNSIYEITHLKYSAWERYWVGRRQIRPIHYAIFTDHWGWQGRLYTGKYGHQSLRKIERSTIEFNGCPSVELDYGGMHTRLLYHLAGIDYREDPYALWGNETTKEQRLIAKTVINVALSARSRESTISSCNLETCTKTSERDTDGNRKRKEGEAYEKAVQLLRLVGNLA